MTFKGTIFSDSDDFSDELGALVDGIISMKLRVTLPNDFLVSLDSLVRNV